VCMKKVKKVVRFFWKIIKFILPYVITAVEKKLVKGGDCNEQTKNGNAKRGEG